MARIASVIRRGARRLSRIVAPGDWRRSGSGGAAASARAHGPADIGQHIIGDEPRRQRQQLVFLAADMAGIGLGEFRACAGVRLAGMPAAISASAPRSGSHSAASRRWSAFSPCTNACRQTASEPAMASISAGNRSSSSSSW